MTPETKSAFDDLFPLPQGVKLRARRFAANPVSEPASAPVGGPLGNNSAPRKAFELHWSDEALQLSVDVRERDNGRMVAEAFCKDASLLGRAAVSVGLVGEDEEVYDTVGGSILLNETEDGGCAGSLDLGPLADAVERLGANLRLVAYLSLTPEAESAVTKR